MDDEASPQSHDAILRALLVSAPTEEQYRLVGEFFHVFSELEFSLRFFLAQALKIPGDYFDIVTAPYDTNALCNVVKALAKKKPVRSEDGDALAQVVSKFQKLNEDRVRIAHGTWTEDSNGLTSRHVSRTSLEPVWHYGTSGALVALVNQARHLQAELLVASVAALRDMNSTREASGGSDL